nr:hypothetical protein [Tanacetum cinerariifolium]
MDMTIDQQVEIDEALVPHALRLRIGRSNFYLLSDISSKKSTLQLVYDVLRLTPFFKDFLVTTDVSEIYMQEFWATATVHHHSIRFKMDNKKHIVNLESFKEMLHICPRLPGSQSDEEGDDDDDEEGDYGDDDDDEQDDDDAQDDDDQEDKGNDEDVQEEGSDDEQASDEEEFIHPSLNKCNTPKLGRSGIWISGRVTSMINSTRYIRTTKSRLKMIHWI